MIDLNSINTVHPPIYNQGGSNSSVNVYTNPSSSMDDYGTHYQTPPVSRMAFSNTGPSISVFNHQSGNPEMATTVVSESRIRLVFIQLMLIYNTQTLVKAPLLSHPFI